MQRIVSFDARALQDPDYAHKGIGQHAGHVLTAIRGSNRFLVAPLADPLLPPIREDYLPLFDAPPVWLDRMVGDAYFNPSPMTHDTAPFVQARRRGMTTGAVMHDLIPLRIPDFVRDPARVAHYRYLLKAASLHDFIAANSEATRFEYVQAVGGVQPVATLHCRSRFRDTKAEPEALATASRLCGGSPYAFFATADDPRKNPEIAVKAALRINALGLRVVIGGGMSEATRLRLRLAFPNEMLLAQITFLPRLSDDELRAVYELASVVVVPSRDEGFSLPVAEAISLGRRVVASDIPAHSEQILLSSLLFAPDDVDGLVEAVRMAEAHVQSFFQSFDYGAEATAFSELLAGASKSNFTGSSSVTLVGPKAGSPTGIAVYNELLMTELVDPGFVRQYVDLDDMDLPAFYGWLADNIDEPMIYVMGNNNVFHSNCYTALQNVPGFVILHDSRLFEFLLNRHGPYYLKRIWDRANPDRPIEISEVEDWQRERAKLPCSFLEPLLAKATGVIVHNPVARDHIQEQYEYRLVRFVPFALQMTDDELRRVRRRRRKLTRERGAPLRIISLGETEPTKACAELVFAVRILLLQGVDATLSFVGKSEGDYHSELMEDVAYFGLGDRVKFEGFATRSQYLQALVEADVLVQLRYPLFGQVSGPLADGIACGVPCVTTEDLAGGASAAEGLEVVPNRFSPLHIAEAIRAVSSSPATPENAGDPVTMRSYAEALQAAYRDLERGALA